MKNFRLQVILRIILIVATVLLFLWLFFETGSIIHIIILVILLTIELFYLFRYTDATNRELSKFLQSIRYSDFSAGFNKDYLGGSFRELNTAFREVMNKFLEARTEKEENFRYLQTVIQHIGTGLISYNQLGDVEFINNAAKKILKINSLKNIRSLEAVSRQLYDKLANIEGGNKLTLKINLDNDLLNLFIYATEFKMRDQIFKLIALQNIQNELEEQEMLAWQKLISVLTHEIMNSITPISSLASTLDRMLPQINSENSDPDLLEDISSAVGTIRKRSEGLLNFVEKYRSITRVPKPVLKQVEVKPLFGRIKLLMDSFLHNTNIEFTTSVTPENLEIAADSDLIEQVLINLLKNAIQSVGKNENGKVSLLSRIDDRGRAIIKVTDNGPGIKEDVIDKVFVPFFSTKQDGSGIGLSLSRQIIRAHGGTIQVTSKPEETVFTIRL